MFKKAILLIHGFAGGTYDLEYLEHSLEVVTNYHVFSFTLPGHASSVQIKATKEDWIKSTEKNIEWLISNGYKNIYVVGHSMGAVIACHIARKYSEVKKLVLLSPAFRYFKFKNNKLDIISSIKNSKDILSGYPRNEVISRIISSPASSVKNFINLVKEHYDDPLFINIPTLIIHGNDDLIAPFESALYVHNNLKSKINILINIKDINHYVLDDEHKEQVCNLVKNFLKNNLTNNKKIINM